MNITFLPHGEGSGRDAIVYLLGERDHKGKIRAGVHVLRGNPFLIGDLIDSLKTVQRYSSAVIAFHIDDRPTEAQLQTVLDDFESVAFCGLAIHQFIWCAVLHDDDLGGKHIHIVVPRVELSTGRAINIAPPGWERTFYHLRNAFNFEHGWARPDDPERARLIQPGRTRNLEVASQRERITTFLIGKILAKKVFNRADVIEALKEQCRVVSQNKNSITGIVTLKSETIEIRLKGPIYHEDFAASGFKLSQHMHPLQKKSRKPPDPDAARVSRELLAMAVQRRAKYTKDTIDKVRKKQNSLQSMIEFTPFSLNVTEEYLAELIVDQVYFQPDIEPKSHTRSNSDDRTREAIERIITQAQRKVRDTIESIVRRTGDPLARVASLKATLGEFVRAGDFAIAARQAAIDAHRTIDEFDSALNAAHIQRKSSQVADKLEKDASNAPVPVPVPAPVKPRRPKM